VWKLKTVQESNDKGSWFNYSVSQLDIQSVPSAVVQECKGLYEMFRKGEIKTSAGTAEEMNSASASKHDDEEIPF